MGRMSTKGDKNEYQIARDNLKMSREKAGEAMNCSADKIARIESGDQQPAPQDIVLMAEVYKQPELCNYYCTHVCEIGKIYMKEVKVKELSQIVLEMLATLNATEKKKDRLIEISADGIITEDEMRDFIDIQEELDRITMTVDALKLWAEKTRTSGEFDSEAYERIMNEKRLLEK